MIGRVTERIGGTRWAKPSRDPDAVRSILFDREGRAEIEEVAPTRWVNLTGEPLRFPGGPVIPPAEGEPRFGGRYRAETGAGEDNGNVPVDTCVRVWVAPAPQPGVGFLVPREVAAKTARPDFFFPEVEDGVVIRLRRWIDLVVENKEEGRYGC